MNSQNNGLSAQFIARISPFKRGKRVIEGAADQAIAASDVASSMVIVLGIVDGGIPKIIVLRRGNRLIATWMSLELSTLPLFWEHSLRIPIISAGGSLSSGMTLSMLMRSGGWDSMNE